MEGPEWGAFGVLTEKLLYRLLQKLSIRDKCNLACTSSVFAYVMEDEDMWKRTVKQMYKANLWFRGSWKRTLLDKNKPMILAPKALKAPTKIAGLKKTYKRKYKNYFWASLNMKTYEIPFSDIDRRSNLSLEEFIEQYDKPQRPVIITDAMKNWPAMKWSKEYLKQHFGDCVLRCGPGYKMSLNNYIQYMETQQEYAPLYLFDGKLEDRAPDMMGGWELPPYFKEDLYSLMNEYDSPPNRWVLMGPARTGPTWHIDPYRTSAWNAVVWGSKRWMLFPPHINPPGAGDPDSEYYEASKPLKWMQMYYDELPKSGPNKPIEFMHRAGEILFLPAGWWHMVINTEDTLAITQNFVNKQNFSIVYNDAKKEPKFHRKFCKQIFSKRPDLMKIVNHPEEDWSSSSSSSSSCSSSASSSPASSPPRD